MSTTGCNNLCLDLEANLGEGYLDDLSSVSADELNGIGAFFASKPVESVLHGGWVVLSDFLKQ